MPWTNSAADFRLFMLIGIWSFFLLTSSLIVFKYDTCKWKTKTLLKHQARWSPMYYYTVICGRCAVDKLLIQEDPALYYFINQGCLTVDNMDDKEEMQIVDVRQLSLVNFLFCVYIIFTPEAVMEMCSQPGYGRSCYCWFGWWPQIKWNKCWRLLM